RFGAVQILRRQRRGDRRLVDHRVPILRRCDPFSTHHHLPPAHLQSVPYYYTSALLRFTQRGTVGREIPTHLLNGTIVPVEKTKGLDEILVVIFLFAIQCQHLVWRS